MRDAQRAEIIRFWRTVEMFSPPSVDKADPAKRVYTVRPGTPLPWEPGHPLARVRLRDTQTWRHVVYVGIFSLESVFDVLSGVFPPDPDSYDERPSGESAVAAFVVSAQGRPLYDSEVLSSCAWATGRALRPGPGTAGWLSGFEAAGDRFGANLREVTAPADDDSEAERLTRRGHPVGRKLTAADLAKCRTAAAAIAGVGQDLPHAEIRIRSEIVARRSEYNTDGHDFLNSFIAADLATVAKQVKGGRFGSALRAYLRADADLDVSGRIDVRTDLATVLAATAPNSVPPGRWPSKPEHSLALSQQLAVNSALGMAGTGIFAVNGPPGTGKTTMLRDLVAAVVVERARRLAGLKRPADAFTGEPHTWRTGNYTRRVHRWQPELTGFEMVVASANNGAVENVTNEIPAAAAVDDCWQAEAGQLDYFPDIASALLNDDEDDAEQPAEPGWALVAARLGNKTNRGKFVNTFWWRKITMTEEDGRTEPFTPRERAQVGLQELLKDYERFPPTGSWSEATARFRKALKQVTDIQAERDRVFATLARRSDVDRTLTAARQALQEARQRMAVARQVVVEAGQSAEAWQVERQRRVDKRREHHEFKPGFFVSVMSLGRATREWRADDRQLAGRVAEADQAMAAAESRREQAERNAGLGEQDIARATENLTRCERELTEVDSILAAAHQDLGRHFPDAQWWADRERREYAALWTDARWNRARTELFLAALRLHKDFLTYLPSQMRQSLQAAADVVGGGAPKDLPEAAALDAWRALFFVVPVVSTTFASFARLFGHLKQEALGWLLIDEAGQATPQNAVGAIWRSKRVVVVGDPLQLEPVTTLPFRAEQAIRRDHGVALEWLTSRTSVQRLADRLTPLGTWLPDDDGQIWVGAPLTVHRRCDQPMFGVVNDIAYDGLMINGTGTAGAEAFQAAYPSLPGSKWIDVVSEQADGHWIPDEGEQVDKILAALAALGVDMSEVMIIAPFRDIARQVRRRANRYRGVVAGTIHTAQGKQADIVILVLGGNPQRPGARRWAASKPNLLNVAVSRAKRRVYVIGNRGAWSRERYFDVLAARLPDKRPLGS